VAQCLHEEETRAVLLRRKGPVRRCALPGRALYPDFLSQGTGLRSVISGKALYPGSAMSGKNIHYALGLCPRDQVKRALKAGKRYIRRALTEFTVVENAFSKLCYLRYITIGISTLSNEHFQLAQLHLKASEYLG